MPSSDITVAALTAIPTLRGNKLAWTYSDPRSGAVPNIALDMVEVHASTTNDRTTASKVGEGITDFLHTGLVEEQTWYYWIKARNYLGHFGDWHPSGSTAGVAAMAIGMSGLVFGLANGKLVASVAGNALTIAVKTAAGNDPSTSDPVYVAFPNATTTIGNYQVRTISAALSIVVPSGASLGVVNINTPFRIWIVLFDDAGALRLGVRNCSDGNGGIFPLADFAAGSSTAISAAAGSIDTFYTGTAVTSKFFRKIGRADYDAGLGTLGAWAAAPDPLRLEGTGGLKPGDTVQDYGANITSVNTTTSVIPFDNTKPQNTEGISLTSLSLTPSSPINVYEFDVLLNFGNSVASEIVFAIFRDSGADALASTFVYTGAADKPGQISFRCRLQAGAGGNRTYDLRYGPSQAGTMTKNGTAGAGKFNGTLTSFVRATEKVG